MWDDLKAHARTVEGRSIPSLFDGDRMPDFAAETGDMRLDFSKTNIDATGLSLLIDLLDRAGVADRRAATRGRDVIRHVLVTHLERGQRAHCRGGERRGAQHGIGGRGRGGGDGDGVGGDDVHRA